VDILTNAKQIAEAVHEIKNLELYQRVLDLHSDIISLVEDNLRLRTENKGLQTTLDVKAKMMFKAPFYYQPADATPFCAACWEKKDPLAVHVVFGHDTDWETRWDCPTCKQMYVIRKGEPPQAGTEVGGPYGEHGWMR
jgi:hypothetical protein